MTRLILMTLASIASVMAETGAPKPNPDVRVHAKPKPLPAGAVTHDWTSFLGPTHNGISTETKLLREWPKGGPTLLWEMEKGTGYSSPAIAGDHLVYLPPRRRSGKGRVPPSGNGREVLGLQLRHAV